MWFIHFTAVLLRALTVPGRLIFKLFHFIINNYVIMTQLHKYVILFVIKLFVFVVVV